MTYETAEHVVKIIPRDDGKGEIHADLVEIDDQHQDKNKVHVFVNKYCEVQNNLNGTKVIEGRIFKTGDTFTFTITGQENAKLPVDEQGNSVSSVTITPEESDKNSCREL